MSLVYYCTEKTDFPEAYGKTVSVEEAEIVFQKLVRHFKLGRVWLEWTSGRNHPMAYGDYKVKLNVDWNNFGVLCHELAHIREKKKYGETGHFKRHRRLMKTMIVYCKRKNWFAEELTRRTAPKIRPEPSKQEVRVQTIQRLEEAIKRHQSKIKRCQTLIKKSNRRIAHLKRFI